MQTELQNHDVSWCENILLKIVYYRKNKILKTFFFSFYSYYVL